MTLRVVAWFLSMGPEKGSPYMPPYIPYTTQRPIHQNPLKRGKDDVDETTHTEFDQEFGIR